MYNGGQWHGFGQEESTEIFRELVENTPQIPRIPVGKMLYQAKLMKKRLSKYISHLAERNANNLPILADDCNDNILPETNC